VVQYTNTENAGAATPESAWVTIGEVNYDGSSGNALRHEYAFPAVTARAVRVIAPEGAALDEIEIYGGNSAVHKLEINTTGAAVNLAGMRLESGH
jgi:hypothetical protein